MENDTDFIPRPGDKLISKHTNIEFNLTANKIYIVFVSGSDTYIVSDNNKNFTPNYWSEHFRYETKIETEVIIDNSINNGGKTDYYQLESAPFTIKDFDDFAEWRKLDGFQFNMGKVMWTFNCGRHAGTDEIRDLNKVIHYAQRRILKLQRMKK